MFKNSLWIEYLLIVILVAIVVAIAIMISDNATNVQEYLDRPIRNMSIGDLILVLLTINLISNPWRYNARK
jgi:hypothetical protein